MRKIISFISKPLIPCVFFFTTSFAQEKAKILVKDPKMNELVSSKAVIQKLGGGFKFTEGPAWSKEGFWIFSDIPANIIYKISDSGKIVEFVNPSGNSNGLAYDKDGNLIICEHSGRRVSKKLPNGKRESIVENYQGKKFNSPNDLTISSQGAIYFADPPYGLSKQDADSSKELKYNGVYRYHQGKLELLDTMSRPNGVVLSPDEKHLYVAQSEINPKWFVYDVQKDGKISNRKVFFDASKLEGEGTPDGLKVDKNGNLFCTGPGGVVVFSPEGKHLGTIQFPEVPANCAFGGKDKKDLLVTARNGVYLIKLKTAGL